MIRHLYLAFWRPDIRDELVKRGSPIVAMCDFIGNAESVVTDTREVSCPACRETFLQALPTGDGSKLTWEAYVAAQARLATNVKTLRERAAEADKADAAWSTSPTPPPPAPPDVWATQPGGWSTGLPATGPGWSSDWTKKP